mmetsp:Transcript_56751/g.64769  ORF Transcript_56751/g.64769 Transcript_56751/m.64769 type:complete len:109 (-) Transcript_56751:170-496(-)|eukprot:CAMPEP_0115024628 /NCGR_PEP_ID=MMETSP0216-20121206/33396_1 /TAXON_ID=223996 /ORGANISM="Protocruzia adherens, Strain Boccale" /LENGTH=108 /DNA_ID=CAMNT_0002398813 /DNA_START=153 /DNA_END=479 /DNA_ORIENTATION=-
MDRGGPRRESVLNFQPYLDREVRIKFAGGREIQGVLKGYDNLANFVLDQTIEFIRDSEDQYKVTDATRKLGLIVSRGTAVMTISLADGLQEVDNPYSDESDDQEGENA